MRAGHGIEIVGATVLGSGLLIAGVVRAAGVDEASLALLMRATARVSLGLFLAAFCASALATRFPSPATRWLLAHRRWLGISFAISHLVHAGVILWANAVTDGAWLAGRARDVIGGSVIYLFILLMLATSFDRTAALVGRRAWTALHRTGMALLWLAFTAGVALKAPSSWAHAALTVLLVAALVLRLSVRRRR